MASNKERLTLYIDKDVLGSAKIKQIRLGQRSNMSRLIERLLSEWVTEHGGMEKIGLTGREERAI